MKNKKYEADKKILELLKKNSSRSLTRENFKEKLPIVRNIGEIEGVLYATFLNAIKRLEEKGDIKIKQEKDPITGKVIERYILVEKEKIANPETMEMIISGLKSKVQIIRACASFDLVTLCRTKKIMNPKHLKFLIEIAIDNKLGLGVGDIVLMVIGSGSRKLEGNTDMPVDCAITAKVEIINIDSKYRHLL